MHCLSRKLCATGGLHRIQLLDEEERENETSIVAFNHGFLTQDNADTLPLVICRKKEGMVRLERHVANEKTAQHTPSHFLFFSSKVIAESF